MKTTAINYMF